MKRLTHRNTLTFALLLTAGCHRSLQIGEPVYTEAGMSDAGVVDSVVVDTSRPWYVRDQAYVGTEMRLPVPPGETLGGLGSGQSTPVLSASAPREGDLLVAYGEKFYSFAATASGPQLSTPGGVRVADSSILLVPKRRLAIPEYWNTRHQSSVHVARDLGVSPLWRTANRAYVSVAQPQWTSRASKQVATNASGDTLVQFVGSPPESIVVRLGHDQLGEDAIGMLAYRDFESTDARLQSIDLVAHGDSWYRAFSLAPTANPNGAARIEIQPFLGIANSRTIVDGPSPWGAAVLVADAPGPCSISASVGDDNLLLVCNGSTGIFARTANLARMQWTSAWARFSTSNNSTRVSSLWDPTAQTFWVAYSNYDNRRPDAASARLMRVSANGVLDENAAPPRVLMQMVLVEWQRQAWVVGVTHRGEFQILRPDQPDTNAVQGQMVGSQMATDTRLIDQSVLTTWSDRQGRTFGTRINLRDQLSLESQLLISSTNEFSPGRHIFIDGDDVYVSNVGQSGYPIALAKLDRRTLSTTSMTNLPVGTLVSVSRQRVFSNTRTGTTSSLRSYDLVGRESNAQPPSGLRTDADNCRGSLCVVTTQDSHATQVLDLNATPPTLRAWQPADVATFPTCEQDGMGYQGRRRIAADGSCGAPYWLPDANAHYICPNDPAALGETCGRLLAIAASENHVALIEPRENFAGTTRVAIRLLERGSSVPMATQWFHEGELLGVDEYPEAVFLTHVSGGLFVLVYHRLSVLSGEYEAYARIVYFPEAETVAP